MQDHRQAVPQTHHRKARRENPGVPAAVATTTTASTPGGETGAASSAFPQGQDEPQAKRVRQDKDDTVHELVEYGLGETNTTAMTKVLVIRRDDDECPPPPNERLIGQDCYDRDVTGKYYVNIHARRNDGGRTPLQPCSGQALARTGDGADVHARHGGGIDSDDVGEDTTTTRRRRRRR